MTRILKESTFQRAEIILSHIETNVSDDLPLDILVSGFTCGTTSGLHLTNATGCRSVNVSGSPTGDGFVVTYGKPQDFDYKNKWPQPTAASREFTYVGAHNAAVFAVAWLEGHIE